MARIWRLPEVSRLAFHVLSPVGISSQVSRVCKLSCGVLLHDSYLERNPFLLWCYQISCYLSAVMELECVTLMEDIGCKLTVTNKS